MTAKLVFVLLACCLSAILATPLPLDDGLADPQSYYDAAPLLNRQARSPQGSVGVEYGQGPFGKSGSVQYNQRVYSSDNGRFNVDAYARASRDFTHNRNDYGGGVMGSWRF